MGGRPALAALPEARRPAVTLTPAEFEEAWRDTKDTFDVSWTAAWNMLYEMDPENCDAYLAYKVERLEREIDSYLASQDPPFG